MCMHKLRAAVATCRASFDRVQCCLFALLCGASSPRSAADSRATCALICAVCESVLLSSSQSVLLSSHVRELLLRACDRIPS